MADTIIIIPAHNEEQTIYNILKNVQLKYKDFDLLVINDGSTDGTVKEVQKTSAKLLNHPLNLGYGATIQTGYKFAYANNYKYLIQMDADGQHNVDCISNIYNELITNNADLVLGSRFSLDSKYSTSFARKFGMRFFKRIVNLITNLNLSDVTTGFQGMNRAVLWEFIQDYFPDDYPDADVIVLAHKKGIRIKEVPVVMHSRIDGRSMHSNPFKVVVYVIQMLISMFILLFNKRSKIL